LKREEATLLVLIGLNAILIILLLVMPSTSFLTFMIPAA
jgi:hypothetical protein